MVIQSDRPSTQFAEYSETHNSATDHQDIPARKRAKIRRDALAFRIWRAATAVEWNATIHEIAEATGTSLAAARNICQRRGWLSRLRAPSVDRRPPERLETLLTGVE